MSELEITTYESCMPDEIESTCYRNLTPGRKFMENGLARSGDHPCVRRLALGKCGSNPPPPSAEPCCSLDWRVFDHPELYLSGGVPACIVGHESRGSMARAMYWMSLLGDWPQLGLAVPSPSDERGRAIRIVLYNRQVFRSRYKGVR